MYMLYTESKTQKNVFQLFFLTFSKISDIFIKSNSRKSVESRRFCALVFCSSQFSGSFLSDKDSATLSFRRNL